MLMAGLTRIGSGLSTVLYASGPIWTALLAYILLHTLPPPSIHTQAMLMAGLTRIGSGLFTVLYASGPIWTALLAYILLHTLPPPSIHTQAMLMAGLTRIGSGLFTVLYASGPIWTALLAYILLQRRLASLQKLALALVMAGLAVAARGSASLWALDETFVPGLVAALGGTCLHALIYVLQEMTLVQEATPIEPPHLCGLIGALGRYVLP
jgi:drug/metabolite transporter (DMT)-like permease